MNDKSTAQADAFEAIAQERAYQQARWGSASNRHEIGTWVLLMQYQLDQARNEIARGTNPSIVLHRLRKTGALAVAAMEDHGTVVRSWVPPPVQPPAPGSGAK